MGNLKIAMSLCTYNNGSFDVMIRDKETGEELILSGTQELTEEQQMFTLRVAPACVWTDFERLTPPD